MHSLPFRIELPLFILPGALLTSPYSHVIKIERGLWGKAKEDLRKRQEINQMQLPVYIIAGQAIVNSWINDACKFL